MDLSGTQLVVLSACETGLGRLYQGEGVYGLRRAFQIAGARTVISTLWPIADELTAPMLPPIYRLSHDPLPNRLRTTQLDWIATLRQNGLSDHPYSWGAFIAQGDWRY
jgi:CHAT domain-containing protein